MQRGPPRPIFFINGKMKMTDDANATSGERPMLMCMFNNEKVQARRTQVTQTNAMRAIWIIYLMPN